MTPQELQDRLTDFVNSLPPEVHNELGKKDLDIVITVLRICGEREWVLYETGGVCDGVRQVLGGEISPAELASVIAKDANIEEDNRVEMPEIAYDMQTRVFDIALPILKAAGYPQKEGRVPNPPPRAVESPYATAPATDNRQPITASSTPPLSTPPKRGGEEADKYVRALARIAAGTTYTEQQLLESFEGLPLGLRQAIASVDTANAIQAIAKKNLLHVDQMSALASESGLVLLGLTHPRDYIANLARRLRVPEAKARDIAKEVSADVLSKVRDSLRTLHEEPSTKSDLPAKASVQAGTPNPKPTSADVVLAKAGNQKTLDSRQRGNDSQKGAVGAERDKFGILAEQAKAGLSTPYTPDASWKTGLPATPPAPASSVQHPAAKIGPTGWRPGGSRPATPPETPKPAATALPATPPPPPVVPKPVAAAPMQSPASAVPLPRPPAPPQTVRPSPPLSTSSLGAAPAPRPPRVFKAPMPAAPQVNTAIPRSPAPGAAFGETVRPPQPTPAAKFRPASEGSASVAAKTPSPDDFLSQKLQAPMGLPREEKKYTVDPYREPIE